MKRYRVSMILATLLTSAAMVNGQSLSSASLQFLRQAEQTTEASEAGLTLPSPHYLKHFPQYFPPSPPYPLPKELRALEEAAKAYYDAPADTDDQSWFTQTLDQGLAAWQKLRAMCQSQVKSDAECCKAGHGVTAAAKPAACCVEGIAGVCKSLVVPSVPSHGVRPGTIMLGGRINSDSGIASFAGSMCDAQKECQTPSSGYRIFIVPVQLAPSVAEKGRATPIMDDLVRQLLTEWTQNQWCGHKASGLEYVLPGRQESPYRDIKSFIQFLPASPSCVVSSAPCSCAKACACCESCKASKAAQPQPMITSFGPQGSRTLPYAPPGIWTLPVPSPDMPRAIVQIAPQPAHAAPPPVWIGPQPAPMVQGLPMSLPIPPRAKHAHFVTPDFDAHCERITHRGDNVILEGNAMLLCKKHAQPIRVEGQRIVVNMKDGSFSVETEIPHAVGTHPRGNAIEMQLRHEVEMYIPVRGTPSPFGPTSRFESGHPPMYPGQRIIQVMPVPPQEHYPQYTPPAGRSR